jgi:hypothetical protein
MSIPLNRLQARLERDLYLPLGFRAALQAAQISWQSAVSDAEAVAAALRRMQRLIQADGVIAWFDSWFEAEVVGARVERDAQGRAIGTPLAPQRLPHSARFLEATAVRHVLDIARRLCEATREQSTVIAAVSGVRTLAAHMVGPRAPDSAYAAAQEAAADIIGALARSYGESGVGAIAVIEDTAMADPIDARSFVPVADVARKLDVPAILLSRHPMPHRSRPRSARSASPTSRRPAGADRCARSPRPCCAPRLRRARAGSSCNARRSPRRGCSCRRARCRWMLPPRR